MWVVGVANPVRDTPTELTTEGDPQASGMSNRFSQACRTFESGW